MQSKIIIIKKTPRPLHYKVFKIELGLNNQIYDINSHLNKKYPSGTYSNFLSRK